MTEQQQHARNLYLQTNFTQQQIAGILDVTRQTVNNWISEGKWKALKRIAETSPLTQIEQIANELNEISLAINSRPVGQRFATPQEAETRRKLISAIRYYKDKDGAGTHMDVLRNFIEFLMEEDPEMVLPFTRHADRYLKGEKHMDKQYHFEPYDLPSMEDPIQNRDEAPLPGVEEVKPPALQPTNPAKQRPSVEEQIKEMERSMRGRNGRLSQYDKDIIRNWVEFAERIRNGKPKT